MDLVDKIVDSTIGLKMKSGANLEIHVIKHDNGEKSLVLERLDNNNERLVLQHQDIIDFVDFMDDFLSSI